MTKLMKPRICCFKRKSQKVSMFKDSNAGNPPGTDGVNKEFLTRYWSLLDQTFHYAQRTFVEKEKWNKFLDCGLIKILLIKDWRQISLVSQT